MSSGTRLQKLVALAYYMGAESTAKSICDQHNQQLAAMRARAAKARYHNLANAIIGPGPDQIYSPHYARDMSTMFGSDKI